jgi:hypothetical protein
MTLLSICQSVADEVGILRPATIISNSDPDAQKLLRFANKVGNRLMKIYPWQVLRKERTFTAISGSTQAGILPDDFDRFVPETFWNRSGSELITGPIGSVEWQGYQTFGYNKPERVYIYRSGDISVLPVMAGGESLAFEYISKNWCQSAAASPQPEFAADTDTTIVNEELLTAALLFSYLDSDGQPSARAGAEFQEYFDTLTENDQPTGHTMLVGDIFGRGGRRFSGAPSVQSILTGIY